MNNTKIQRQHESPGSVGLAMAVVAILFAPLGAYCAAAEQSAPPQVQSSEKQSSEKQPANKQKPKVISPLAGEVLLPFNGQDLTGFTSWLQGIGTEDPDHVYTVKEGTLHLNGEGMGYLATACSYENYHLSLEYRWGKKVDGSGYVRNSGILLHATGPDGNAGGVWMASIECQLAQGCEGDLIVIRGKDAAGKVIPVTLASDTIVAKDGNTRWSPQGKETVFSKDQFWWSRHQVDFTELLDARGKDDVASPLGEWTRVDCICQADRITIKINGVTVNECYDVFPSSGKILLECEDNEVFFRNIEIRPLSPSSLSKP